MSVSYEQINKIVEDVVRKFAVNEYSTNMCWLCDDPESAIQSAKAAQHQLIGMSLAERSRIIEAMRCAARENAKNLAELACQETGYGRIEDKIKKNQLVADKTPGIEDLHTSSESGDFGLTIVERAPYGVICAITPSTNPAASVINNAISMVAAGNAVVFNPHPAAKEVSIEAMRILNKAIEQNGGPKTLLCTVKEPDINTGTYFMKHKDVAMLAITGGEAVVKVAMKIGKKVIAAGPGNPPVIVDDTADIKQAAEFIIAGASFDNNLLCICEKEVFALSNIAEELMDNMENNGAFRISGTDIERVSDTILQKKDDKYLINRKFVGKNAAMILKESGVSFTGDPRMVIANVNENHPFITVEMMMPVLGIVAVPTIEKAIEMAVRAENGYKHSAMIYSKNINHLSMAAKALDTTIFVKNAPCYSALGFNGEGFPTMTIATPTGEGLTSARSFTRTRRCVLYGNFRIV